MASQCQSTGAPLTTFHGWLKQVDITKCDYVEAAALRTAFSNLWSYTSLAPEKRHELEVRLPFAKFDYQERHDRRFAGFHDLLAGRYFTVCESASGEDGRALIDELSAYSPPESGLYIFDIGYDQGRVGLDIFGKVDLSTLPKSKTLICIFDVANLNPATDLSKLFNRNPSRKAEICRGRNALLIEVPYVVSEVTIESVLDLRETASQTWLAESLAAERMCVFCGSLQEVYTKESGHIVVLEDRELRSIVGKPAKGNEFLRWLPALLDPNPGGNSLTESIGRYLRTNKVNALIYPSARTNCGVLQSADKETCAYGGWNLVDYRNAPIQTFDASMYLDPIRMLKLGNGINLSAIKSGDHNGTWLLLRGLDVRFGKSMSRTQTKQGK